MSKKELQLIKYKQKVKSDWKGNDINVWTITLRGLFNLLVLKTEPGVLLDKKAYAHKDKLLIFKKWDFFKTQKLDKLIKTVFKSVLEYLGEQQLFLI